MRIVLVGAPGSGKGTQAAMLARDFDVPHISSGDLLREAAKSNTSAGPEIARDLARGDLVPDDLILATMREAFDKALESGGFVLDGFPRSVTQARRAEPFLAPDAVVHLDVPDDVARARLARRTGEGRADDAEREVIERRLRHFHDEIGPILQHYRDRGVLVTVDANRPADDVHRVILDRIDKETRDMAVKLSQRSFQYAKELVNDGHWTYDERDAWSEHQPTAAEENHFIEAHGFDEYGLWYLGRDDEAAANTKGHYKFPHGDFKKVHRCGLLAAESRAGQRKYSDIERAVAHLHGMLDALHSAARARR